MFISENINWDLKREEVKNEFKKVRKVSIFNFIDENDEDLQQSVQKSKSERINLSLSDQLQNA
jgi:hypothetical protein